MLAIRCFALRQWLPPWAGGRVLAGKLGEGDANAARWGTNSVRIAVSFALLECAPLRADDGVSPRRGERRVANHAEVGGTPCRAY